jgi:microcystin-dependent protein
MLSLVTETNPGSAQWFALVPTGTVLMWAAASAPEGYLLCNGASLARASYPDLFSAIGTTFGSVDGASFSLPDFRGRSPLGVGQGAGLTNRTLAQQGGAETVTLATTEIPSHSHTGTTDSAGTHTHTSNAIGGQGNLGLVTADGNNTVTDTDGSLGELNVWTTPQALSINDNGAHTHTFTSNTTGDGGAHANMAPFLALNFIIKI